jgi:RluA family pseudouridine synthase
MAYKARWKGRTLVDVFCHEFSHASIDYWSTEFLQERIICNDSPASPSHVWNEGDQVVHLVHRHESPIVSARIAIVHDDDGYLVVNKPASVPCHPCGTYRKNSLVFILAAMGWRNLRIVHRLDRQTSGIVVFARTQEHAKLFADSLVERKLRKRYLARVLGQFPSEPTYCDRPLSFDEKSMLAYVDCAGGKEAWTSFQLLRYDARSDCSIVECEPKTGRTHQIRVHLQFLGYPIANDDVYSGKPGTGIPSQSDNHVASTKDVSGELRLSDKDMDPKGTIKAEGRELACSNCPYVANAKGLGQAESMSIFLHALEYQGDGWKYTTDVPAWAHIE